MIYYMHTKTFFEKFLSNESTKDILNAQYVCVSTHIRRKDKCFNNIIIASDYLYPNASVLNLGTFEDMEEAYYDQLHHDTLPLLAEFVRGSIEDNLNIILLCTKGEWQLRYIKWLAKYIMKEFEYPVYNYRKYIDGCPLYEYDKDKVLKHVKSITDDAAKKLFNIERKTKTGRNRIIKRYESMSKKELKKICIEEELYYEGMSKEEMLDMLTTFL